MANETQAPSSMSKIVDTVDMPTYVLDVYKCEACGAHTGVDALSSRLKDTVDCCSCENKIPIA